MPRIKYIDRNFSRGSLELIQTANAIIQEYQSQGFQLSLRQVYYQFVARAIIPNKQTEYKRLGSILNDARLAGLVDWNAIEDRTRELDSRSKWGSPGEIIQSAADSYHIDLWEGQDQRPEVWIEKDALEGVIRGVCEELDVAFFSCRGNPSQSAVWAAGVRLRRMAQGGQQPVVFHLGDHDPTGMDMTRDITDRLELFTGGVEVRRLALNMDQVDQYQPPPNPAKDSDSRYQAYVDEYGDESWELDALEPQVLSDLIRTAVEELRDEDLFREREEQEEQEKASLELAATRWEAVEEFLGESPADDE